MSLLSQREADVAIVTDPIEKLVQVLGGQIITDQLWKKIALPLSLPDKARSSVELGVYEYRERQRTKQTPAEIKASLLAVAEAALQLQKSIKVLSDRERLELEFSDLDFVVGSKGDDPSEQIETLLSRAVSEVEGLQIFFRHVANSVTKGRRGQDAGAVRALVKTLDDVLYSFLKSGVKRSNRIEQFIVGVCQIANPDLGPGSIRGAIVFVQNEQKKRAAVLRRRVGINPKYSG
jgi:hypothetical protein